MMVDVRRSRARDVGIILVLALLAVDAVLVVMALRSPPAPPEVTVADNPPVVATTDPAVEPTPTPTETATPTPEPVPPASGRELPLSVLDAERAMRSVQPGTCADGGGVVEFTEDGGATWEAYQGTPDLAVLRVRITDEAVWFVAADRDCRPDFARSEDGGQTWPLSGRTRNIWHLLGEPDSTEIHVPVDSTIAGPCTAPIVVELESVGDVAHALCADGSVHVISGAGGTWSLVGIAPGARAMGVRGDAPVVAAVGVEGCAGLAVQEVTVDAVGLLACVEGAGEEDVALAFSADGQVGYLLSGGATYTSEDSGATWNPAA